MTVTTAIEKAFQEAKGKPTPPAVGTPKYNSLIILADSMQKIWAAEPGVEWNSLYSRASLGAITAASTFALPSTVDYVVKRETDPVYAESGSQRKDYLVVQPNQLYIKRDYPGVAQVGQNLIFHQAFTSTSEEFGWTLKAPCILKVNDLDAGSDTIQVDDPMWLVFMMAADFIRNDLVRQNQYDRLVAYAQETMKKMKEKNQGQNEEVSTEWAPMGGEGL